MHRWEELKIGCFAPLNPRLAKAKAADLVDNFFHGALEKSGYVAEWMKEIGELYKEREVSILNKRDRLSRLSIR